MAGQLPPSPMGVPPGHAYWNDWYEKLRQLINGSLIGVIWANIDFTGSNITDITSRSHQNLQSLQGGTAGEYYHMTSAQSAALGVHNSLTGLDGGTSGQYYHLTSAQYSALGAHNSLTGLQGGTSGEYYHLTSTQHTRATGFISASGDPGTGDIAAGQWALYKNTTSGLLKLWANDAGTMKSVTLT